MSPVAWQRIEGAGIFAAAVALAGMTQSGWPLWLWPLVLLAPDLSMIGYLAGARVGAAIYNAAHLYANGLILALLGLLTGQTGLIAAGAVGNLIDRVHKQSVTDFLRVQLAPPRNQ